jgi:hypothetical protein
MAAEPDCTFQAPRSCIRISPCAAACARLGTRASIWPSSAAALPWPSRAFPTIASQWLAALKLAEGVADDVLAPFLVLAVAARGLPLPG